MGQARGSPGLYRYVVAKGATRCIAASCGLYTGPGGGLDFYVSAHRGTTYDRSPAAGNSVWDGRWHMAVGTFDGTTVRLYVDGAEVGSGSVHPGSLEYLLRDSNDFFIGDYPGCSGRNIEGMIDEVNVWRGALTAAEARSAFAAAVGSSSGTGQPTPPKKRTPTPPHRGSGGTQGSGSANHVRTAPIITNLVMSPRSFRLATTRRGLTHWTRRGTGTTISYVDSQAAKSTFSVLVRKPGHEAAGRCRVTGSRALPPRVRPCLRYVTLGTLTRTDRPGRNRFHFTGLRGKRPAAGAYSLTVTPRSRGAVGRTVVTTFTVIH